MKPKLKPLLLMNKPNPVSILLSKVAGLAKGKATAKSIKPEPNDGRNPPA